MYSSIKMSKKKKDLKKKDPAEPQTIGYYNVNCLKIETNSPEQLQIKGHKGYETQIFKESLGVGVHYYSIKLLKPHSILINSNFYGTPSIRFGIVNSLLNNNKKLSKIFSLGSNEGTYAIKSDDKKLIASDKRFINEPSSINFSKIKPNDVISLVLVIKDFKNPNLLEDLISPINFSNSKNREMGSSRKRSTSRQNEKNKELDINDLNEKTKKYTSVKRDDIWQNETASLTFYINGKFAGSFEQILEGEYKVGVSLYMGARVMFEWNETEIKNSILSNYL